MVILVQRSVDAQERKLGKLISIYCFERKFDLIFPFNFSIILYSPNFSVTVPLRNTLPMPTMTLQRKREEDHQSLTSLSRLLLPRAKPQEREVDQRKIPRIKSPNPPHLRSPGMFCFVDTNEPHHLLKFYLVKMARSALAVDHQKLLKVQRKGEYIFFLVALSIADGSFFQGRGKASSR